MYRFAAGVCWAEPRLINIPANRVQTSEWVFPSGQESAAYLLQMWLKGYELDLNALDSVNASSCHVEMALPLKQQGRPEPVTGGTNGVA